MPEQNIHHWRGGGVGVVRGGLCSSDQAAGIAEREKEEVGQPDLWYCEEKSSDAVTVVCVCVCVCALTF